MRRYAASDGPVCSTSADRCDCLSDNSTSPEAHSTNSPRSSTYNHQHQTLGHTHLRAFFSSHHDSITVDHGSKTMRHCQHRALSELITNRSLNQLIRSTRDMKHAAPASTPLKRLTHCPHWQSPRRSPRFDSSSEWLVPDRSVASDPHSDSIRSRSPTTADHLTSPRTPVASAAPTTTTTTPPPPPR